MDESAATEFKGGFAPIVRADGDVSMREAGSLVVVAGGNAEINEAGAGLCLVGGNLSLTEAGTGNLIVGGNAELSSAGVGQMLALEATITDSKVGVLLAGKANLERSEVLIGTPQAAVLGAVAGALIFILSRLFRRA